MKVEMSFIGNPQVIRNLLLKKELLDQSDPSHEQLRTALILPGGGQRGVVQGGAAVGLEKHGLMPTFDNVVAVSTGAGVALYCIPEDSARGVTVYYQDNVVNRFIRYQRPWNIMDVARLEQVFRSDKAADLVKLVSARPNLWVGVTDQDTGLSKFINAKEYQDPMDCIIESVTFPYLSRGGTPHRRGSRLKDGTVGNPLPISYAMNELRATDILAFMNQPMPKRRDRYGFPIDWLYKLSNKGQRGPELLRSIATYQEKYCQELEYFTGEREVPSGVRIAGIYPSAMPIGTFCQDPHLLERGMVTARDFTFELIENLRWEQDSNLRSPKGQLFSKQPH